MGTTGTLLVTFGLMVMAVILTILFRPQEVSVKIANLLELLTKFLANHVTTLVLESLEFDLVRIIDNQGAEIHTRDLNVPAAGLDKKTVSRGLRCDC